MKGRDENGRDESPPNSKNGQKHLNKKLTEEIKMSKKHRKRCSCCPETKKKLK